MDTLMWVIAALGALTLGGVFFRMKDGFGPFNLRAVGLPLVAILAALVALAVEGSLNPAMGVFGAIVGYLVGLRDKP